MNLRTRPISGAAIPFLILAGCFVALVMASAVAPGTVLADSAAEQYTEPPAPPAPPTRGGKKTSTSPRSAKQGSGGAAVGENGTAAEGPREGNAAGRTSSSGNHSGGLGGERGSREAATGSEGSEGDAGESDKAKAAALMGGGGSGGGGGGTGTLLLLLVAGVPLLAGAGYFVWSKNHGDDDARNRLRGLHGS